VRLCSIGGEAEPQEVSESRGVRDPHGVVSAVLKELSTGNKCRRGQWLEAWVLVSRGKGKQREQNREAVSERKYLLSDSKSAQTR
jgi:hypothetical protein